MSGMDRTKTQGEATPSAEGLPADVIVSPIPAGNSRSARSVAHQEVAGARRQRSAGNRAPAVALPGWRAGRKRSRVELGRFL